MSAPVIPGIDDLVVIGHGGFSVVYKGLQRELGREVAVKVISSRDTPELTLDRWRREVTAMGRLSNHPNIVQVYAGGMTENGSPYLVMPYVPDGSLGERLRRHGPMGPADVAVLGAKLAGALSSAHAAGILHRDVKPDNVLMSPYGEPQLTDFGIARLMGRSTTTGTQAHASIAFAAPEILDGRPSTEASDVYSLGATLFAALAGTPPFSSPTDESVVAVIGRIATQPPPDLREKGVPDELASAIEAALAKRPEHRIGTADELRRRLAAAAESLGAALPPAVAGPTVAVASDGPAPWRPRDEFTPDPAEAGHDAAPWGSGAGVAALDDDITTVAPAVANPATSRATAASWRDDDHTVAGDAPGAPGTTVLPAATTGPRPRADVAAPPPAPPGTPADGSDERDQRPLLLGAVAALVVLVLLALGAVALFGDPEDEVATSPSSVIAAVPSTTVVQTIPPSTTTTRPTTTTTAPTTTTTEAPTTTTTAAPAGDPASVATGYFSALSQKNLAGAYAMLTPEFRAAQSFASFSSFWGGFGSVQVAGPATVTGPGSATIPVTIDGRSTTYNLTMANVGGTLMVDGPRPRG